MGHPDCHRPLAIHLNQPHGRGINLRIFTRYILREVVGYALLGGVLFTFILFMK